MIIEVNNKQWTKIQLNAGFACLAPQTPCGFFLSRTDLGTDVNNLDTRLDVLSFSTSLAGNLKSSLDIWVLSTIDNALISYETDVVSGAKVIFISQGGGGGGQTGSYTFNSPLSEINGNVNLNFDTNGLKLQNDRLTLDLTTYQDFLDVQNEIANINTDINALEMQDNLFTQDINDLKTRVGSVTLQTTSQDLSGAVNELKAGITSNTLTFQGALQKVGNDVSIGLENDITLNATGDKLTLKLLSNSDFRNALLGIDEAKRIATFTDVGRVKPLQNHFTLNAMNGELGLDLSQTGVLTSTFVTNTNFQNLQTSVSANTQNITRIDNEIADIDNTVNDLEANKANSNEVYLKTETYSQSEVDNLLLGKADTTSLTPLENQIQTNTGNITQNQTDIQNTKQSIQTLDSEVVKLTNIQQNIDGLKTFLKELTTNNIKATDNGIGYGAVDIRSQDGYFSISEDGGAGAAQLLAAAGFIDTTTTFRIRNLAGGLVTFNTLVQYESTLTPTDDKDLVPLATLNTVKQELLHRIESLPLGMQWIGVIAHTSTEVTDNPSLLTEFVQSQKQRIPQDGDFIRTSDSFGFIYSQSAWVDFGQVSISIASTTSAGIIMFGTNAGELEDIGDGRAKVIGWDTVKQALQDINSRLNSKADDSRVVHLTGDQTIAGAKTFTGGITSTTNITVSKSAPTIVFNDTTGNKQCSFGTIDNGTNLAFTAPSGGAVQFNGTLRYLYTSVPTVTNNNEIPSLGQIKTQFAGLSTANTFTQTQTFNTLVFRERLRYTNSSMSLAPSTDRRGTIWLTDGSVGSSCVSDINLANTAKILNCPTPTNSADVANKQYVDNTATKILPAGTTPTTADIGVGQVGYVLRS